MYFFYELFSLENMFVEIHGLLSRINIVPYSINQPLKLRWIQMQMGGAYTMKQHPGLHVIPIAINVNYFISLYIPQVLWINLFKQTNVVTRMHSIPLIFLWFIYQNVSNS